VPLRGLIGNPVKIGSGPAAVTLQIKALARVPLPGMVGRRQGCRGARRPAQDWTALLLGAGSNVD